MGHTLPTADAVIRSLRDIADTSEEAKTRKRVANHEPVFGVRMGALFDVAKSATDLPDGELDTLLAHDAYEPRMVAFCVLDFRARRSLTPDERAGLARAYLGNHDAITTWDMVDRAAPRVLGMAILYEALDAAVLDDLAASRDPLRRRSAITAPLWFVKKGGVTDVQRGLAIADMLSDDDHPHVRSAVRTHRKHAERRLS